NSRGTRANNQDITSQLLGWMNRQVRCGRRQLGQVAQSLDHHSRLQRRNTAFHWQTVDYNSTLGTLAVGTEYPLGSVAGPMLGKGLHSVGSQRRGKHFAS